MDSLKKTVQTLTGFLLHDYQLEFLYDCLTKQYVGGVFCRQSGKSTCIAIYTVLFMTSHPNSRVIVVAPTDRQSGELFEKIRRICEENELPRSWISSRTQRSLKFKNGSNIISLPIGPTGVTIRGFTADLIVMEEAAFIPDKIVAEVIMPMGAATNAQVIKIGTPFGMNHFYKSSRDTSWAVHQYDYKVAVAAGQISESFVESQRRLCTALQFRTEYGAEFIPDEDSYFGYELVRGCIQDIEPLNGPRDKMTYILGCDFARMGEDANVFVVVEAGKDEEPHRVVYIQEIKQTKLDVIIDFVLDLYRHWHFQRIYMDETGLGAGVTDVLARELNPTRQKTKVSTFNSSYYGNDIVVGVTFTMKNKLDIFSNAKLLMERGKVLIPHHTTLDFQLQDFRYEQTASMHVKLHHPDGGHDDYCDAFALACRGVAHESDMILDFARG